MKKKIVYCLGLLSWISACVSAEPVFFRLEGTKYPLCLAVSALSHENNPVLIIQLCNAGANQAFYFLEGHLFSQARPHAMVTNYQIGRYNVALLASFIQLDNQNKNAFFDYHAGYLIDRDHPNYCLMPQSSQRHSLVIYDRCKRQHYRWGLVSAAFTDEEIRSPEGLCATLFPDKSVRLDQCTGATEQRWHYDYLSGQISSFRKRGHAFYCWSFHGRPAEDGLPLGVDSCVSRSLERFNFLDGQSLFYRRVLGYYVAPHAEVIGERLYLHSGYLLYPFFHRGQQPHEIRFLQQK